MNWLSVLFALDMLNLAIFLPVFSPFIRSIGATPFTLGLINSASALVSLLWNPIVGSLSDQIGRKRLLITCLIASATGSIIMASSTSLLVVAVGKLFGAMGTPVGILLRSTVADVYESPEAKILFFSRSASIMQVAFLVGSLSSGFLSETKHGFTLAFLFMACIMGVAAIIANKTVNEDNKLQSAKKDISFTSTAIANMKSAIINIKTINWPKYKYLFYVKGCYDFSIATIITNVGFLLLNEYNVKGRTIGYVFVMISICRIVSSRLKLKLKNVLLNISDTNKIVAASLLLLISYTILSISNSLGLFLVVLALMSIARAFMDTTLTEIITTRTTQDDRGKVIGAFENLYSFAMFVAPVLSGVVAELFGQRLLIGSATVPISIALYAALKENQKTE
ncbi:major facilitator superfamily domain-containing protein 9-like [Anthonomus grandis grandis]|uniref:major facilitator superfamily domain-containing protein 9-like n=1 Tax=Anthonomus grandis grandis TaxID=2921223 RepID=UPI0021650775|nr:major facilitator superfamily domain-containing protein 9-like [Anthonomus grandis grandis]